MNLILLHEEDFLTPRRVRLVGRRCEYVRQVHRARPGDALRVGRLSGPLGTGIVVEVDERALVLDVALGQPPPPPAPLHLLLALPRPKVLRRVLQCAAAMGVKTIVLLNTWRVEKSFWQSPALAPAALREELLLGLEQGGDTVLPVIELQPRFKPFVEDELPARLSGRRALLAHPGVAAPCPRGLAEPATIAVGPEGGFTAYELEALQALGFTPVSLGPRRLRVEHAVPALLGRLL